MFTFSKYYYIFTFVFPVSCLEIQKGLYSSDDRRIAETHYQIGEIFT